MELPFGTISHNKPEVTFGRHVLSQHQHVQIQHLSISGVEHSHWMDLPLCLTTQ